MAYVEFANMKGRIPEPFLTQSLDDDADGVVDAWEEVQQQACDDVDSPLSGKYTTPFEAPYPKIVIRAARIFAAEMCYARRGTPAESNPWKEQADELRKHLKAIGEGDKPLSPAAEKTDPSGTLISEPSRTYSTAGRLAV